MLQTVGGFAIREACESIARGVGLSTVGRQRRCRDRLSALTLFFQRRYTPEDALRFRFASPSPADTPE